jgi:hypothetical protein
MMRPTTYTVGCKRYFVENREGKKVPMTLKYMELEGPFIVTEKYKVTRTRRAGEAKYSVAMWWAPRQPFWDKAPQDFKWKRCTKTMDRDELAEWLKTFLCEDTEKAICELENAGYSKKPAETVLDKLHTLPLEFLEQLRKELEK